MVRGVNRIILMGNLTADPELRYTASGSAVATFRLAVNRTFRDADGELKEDTQFINVVAWGKTAETCTQYLGKGRGVLVEGRLNIRDYEKDGERRWITEVVASRVVFLGGSDGTGTPTVAEETVDDVPFY
ncbi:MAG: single-stranded DNA-binding protein [Candidatus Zixiibacteriota bacterium]|jgi:single-strand DNA-binding protein